MSAFNGTGPAMGIKECWPTRVEQSRVDDCIYFMRMKFEWGVGVSLREQLKGDIGAVDWIHEEGRNAYIDEMNHTAFVGYQELRLLMICWVRTCYSGIAKEAR